MHISADTTVPVRSCCFNASVTQCRCTAMPKTSRFFSELSSSHSNRTSWCRPRKWPSLTIHGCKPKKATGIPAAKLKTIVCVADLVSLRCSKAHRIPVFALLNSQTSQGIIPSFVHARLFWNPRMPPNYCFLLQSTQQVSGITVRIMLDSHCVLSFLIRHFSDIWLLPCEPLILTAFILPVFVTIVG